MLLLFLILSSAAEEIYPNDFLVSKQAFGMSAISHKKNNSITFFTFSGAFVFDTYQSNIRITTIESVEPLFIKSWTPKSDKFPKDRIFYGMFEIGDYIYIYGGLGFEDVMDDLWAFNSKLEVWEEVSHGMIDDDTKRRIPGSYDFAATEYVDGNYSDFVFLGGVNEYDLGVVDCKNVKIDMKTREIEVHDCFNYSMCTGIALSGAQVKYYKGKLYLFSGINLEAKYPRYFTGLCVLDLDVYEGWKRVETENELVSSNRGGSVVYKDQIIYFFGSNYNSTKKNYISDVYSLNLSAPEKGWTRIFSSKIGCDSFSHILNDDKIYVFGGLCSKDTILTTLNLELKETKSYYFKTPTHRIGSSFTRSSNSLYLFGGESQLFYHSSVWRYVPKPNKITPKTNLLDFKSEVYKKSEKNYKNPESNWTSFEDMILQPSRRKNMASVSQGYFLLIAGGIESNGEYLNDFWILNTNTMTWVELVPNHDSPRPSGFAYACVVLKVPYFYLIGGLSNERVPINEIWRYDLSQDSMIKLKPTSKEFPAKYEFGCKYEKSRKWVNGTKIKRESIFTYFGKNDEMGNPDCEVERVDILGVTYKYQNLARSGEVPCRTSAASHYENNKLVVVGGKALNGQALSDIWVLTLNETHVTSEVMYKDKLTFALYGSAYESFNQYLFMFSGFEKNGNSGAEGASDLIYKIDLNKILSPALCDLGFENRNGTCQKCPRGTFASQIGGGCEKCLPEGALTKNEGAIAGIECAIILDYLSDSSKHVIEEYLGHDSREENEDFIYQTPDMVSFYIVFGVIIAIFIFIFLFVFFAFKNCGMFFIEKSLLDDFKEKKEIKIPGKGELEHPLLVNEKEKDKAIKKMAILAIEHKNKEKKRTVAIKIKKVLNKNYTAMDIMKGVLTGLIIVALLAILIYLPVDYIIRNKKEKIELIPTVAFRKQFQNPNNNLEINIVTYPFNYGNCSVDLNRSELISTELHENIIYHNQTTQSGAFACHVKIKVKKSDIYENDFILVNFIHNNIYAKNILVWAEAGTAKPGFISKYFQQLNSTLDKSFDGRTPSLFKFLIVPAYFQEEGYFFSNFNNSGMTIHSNSMPESGSEARDSHLHLGSSLSLKIALIGSESSMLTSVYLETGLVEFLSTLSAQLLGVFGVFEGVYMGILYLIMKFKLAKREEELIRFHSTEGDEEDAR